MRSLFISTLIVAILIISWMVMYNFIVQSVEDINSVIANMENTISNDNWDSTLGLYNTVNEKWENTRKVLMLILDHEEMEKINLALERTEGYISAKNKSLTLGEVAALKYFFSHVKEKESLSLKNIF